MGQRQQELESDGFVEPDGGALGLPQTFGTLEGEVEQDQSFLGEEAASRTTIGEEDQDDEPTQQITADELLDGTGDGTGAPAGTGEAETEQETQDRLYAGRYPTQEAFEQGYKDIQSGFTRVVQENRQLVEAFQAQEQQNAAQMERLQQLEQMFIERAMAEDPEFAAQYQAQQQVQQLVDQRVEGAVGPLRQQAEQQQQITAEQQQRLAFAREAENVVRGFWAENEISQGDETDVAMRGVMERLVTAGVPVSPANPEHLQIVMEATQNPQIMFELANARPEVLQIPGGLDYIRHRAGAIVPATDGSPSQGTQPTSRGAVRRRVETYVETGGGAPQGGTSDQTLDEFGEAEKYYNTRFHGKGPLFGSARG